MQAKFYSIRELTTISLWTIIVYMLQNRDALGAIIFYPFNHNQASLKNKNSFHKIK